MIEDEFTMLAFLAITVVVVALAAKSLDKG